MRLSDADYILFALGVFTSKEPESANFMRGIQAAREIVENAPTVGGWISVKDRLPEEHAEEHPYEFEQYLCATVWNSVRIVGFGKRIGDDKQHFWSGNSIWDDWVTHWMPLPELP